MEVKYMYGNASTDEMLKLNERCKLKAGGGHKLTIVEDGVILPHKKGEKPWGLGGVVDSQGHFVEESMVESFGGMYPFDADGVEINDAQVVFLGYTIAHWGTFLVDFTRRLYFYFLSDKRLKIAFCGVGFEKGSFGAIERNCYAFLSLLGIEREDVLDIRTPTRFQKVYVPEVGFDFGKWIMPEYKIPFQSIREKLIEKGNVTRADKIYFTRCQFSTKKESGEKYIQRFFQKNGFQVVAPETIDVIEQIKLVAGCQVVASLEGTVAHNILFAAPGTRQVIIRKQQECNPRQPLFNMVTDTEVCYIDCYYEPFRSFPVSHDDGPFLILFNKKMRKYAKDHCMKYEKRYLFYNIRAVGEYMWSCLKYQLGGMLALCAKIRPEKKQ